MADRRGHAGHSIIAVVIIATSTLIAVIMINDLLNDMGDTVEPIQMADALVDAVTPLLAFIGLSVVVIVAFASVASRTTIGAEPRGCGCGMRAPETRSEAVETNTEWRRREDGVKVVWEQVAREMRRCEACGGHFHVDDPEVLEQREAWPEAEPEILPDDEALMTAEWNSGTVIKDE